MIDFPAYKKLLLDKEPGSLEKMAELARSKTILQFGKVISFYTPLYLSNHCDNLCLYCGFHKKRNLTRSQLTIDQIHSELRKISSFGIQNILLLTGESPSHTPLSYIKDAVKIAGDYFSSISLEIYPLETDEYRELYQSGVDGITIYQETYNEARYKELHVSGKKRDFSYRYQTPERIADSGIRMISMGVLLGLFDPVADTYSLLNHLETMEKKYPGIEYSVSFPRIIPIRHSDPDYTIVSDFLLVKLICLTRILFPHIGINLSTRESPSFRDHAIKLGVTRISAASKTQVGGYTGTVTEQTQFDVQDHRSVQEMTQMVKDSGYDPVFTDWRRINSLPSVF